MVGKWVFSASSTISFRRVKVAFATDQYSVRLLLCHPCEGTLDLRGSTRVRDHPNQRNSQSVAGIAEEWPGTTVQSFLCWLALPAPEWSRRPLPALSRFEADDRL
jgi:hypothetical protein